MTAEELVVVRRQAVHADDQAEALGRVEIDQHHLAALSQRLLAELPRRVPDCRLTGHPTSRLPGHASFAFRDVEIAHRACTVCHLGNLAYWLGRPLKWDPVKEVLLGDEEASRWLDRPKREPWSLS